MKAMQSKQTRKKDLAGKIRRTLALALGNNEMYHPANSLRHSPSFKGSGAMTCRASQPAPKTIYLRHDQQQQQSLLFSSKARAVVPENKKARKIPNRPRPLSWWCCCCCDQKRKGAKWDRALTMSVCFNGVKLQAVIRASWAVHFEHASTCMYDKMRWNEMTDGLTS